MTPLTPLEKAYCERALADLLEPKSGIDGALLASPDGFEIAWAIRGRTLPRAQIAAMSSSLFAVGAAMAHELRLGACRNVVVEAATGTLLLFTVPCKRAPLVLWSIATSDATLGMALISTRTCARDVARHLDLDVGHLALDESRVRVP